MNKIIFKMWHPYIYTQTHDSILFSLKRSEILPYETTVREKVREKQIPYDLTYMWSLKRKNSNLKDITHLGGGWAKCV